MHPFKTFPAAVAGVAVAMACLTSAATAATPRICLDLSQVQSSSSKDGKILTFRMRDGTVYNNHLQQRCDGLIFGGFSWVLQGGDNRICEQAQTLRALTTGENCTLGKFDPPTKAASQTKS